MVFLYTDGFIAKGLTKRQVLMIKKASVKPERGICKNVGNFVREKKPIEWNAY